MRAGDEETAARRIPDDLAVPSALKLLRGWTERDECLGGQLFAWRDGRVVADVTVGRSEPGRPAGTGDTGRLYCAVKPLAACCLAQAVEAGQVSFDDPVSRFVPDFSSGPRAGITLRQLLSHTSGLPNFLIDPYRRGFREIARIAGRYPFPPHMWYASPHFNEELAWSLLAVTVERLSGLSFAEAVQALMSGIPGKPGLCTTFPDPAAYVPCQLRRDGAYSPVAEPVPAVLFRTDNPAHGGFSSARDLGLFYAELVRCATGDGAILSQAGARELIRRQSDVQVGRSKQPRACGLGFMTNVAGDGIGGGWSSESFGAAGYVSWYRVVHAFGDPVHRIAVSIRLFSAGPKNDGMFARLGRALWSDLGLSSGAE